MRAILVLAARFGQGSLSVSQIAKKEGISVAYLEQILNALKRKGMVKSVRGPQGGYILSKKPSDINLQSLFYTLEEKNRSALNGKQTPVTEMDEVSIANLMFWKKLNSSIEKGLAGVTLKDLIDDARRVKKQKPGNASYNFHI